MKQPNNSAMPDDFPKPSKRFVAAALIGTVVVGGGLYKANQASNDSARNHFSAIEQAAITEVDTAVNGVIVVRAGATYRTTPKLVSSNEGTTNTIAGTVPEGQVLRADRPIKYVDEAANTWFGFSLNTQNSANAEDLLWINSTQLNDPNVVSEPYVTEFGYGNKQIPLNPAGIAITLNAEQEIRTLDLEDGYAMATGQLLSNEAFTQQANREQLTVIG